MKSLSDVINDSEDCSGVISSTPVTDLFTVFSPREWLFGIWTNVTWNKEFRPYMTDDNIQILNDCPDIVLHCITVICTCASSYC